MPVTCTYKEISDLRDSRVPGPLSKLQAADEKIALVERARIAKWLKPVLGAFVEYERKHFDLLKQHGTPRMDPATHNLFYDLPEPALGKNPEEIADLQKKRDAYDAEFKKLQETTITLEITPLPSPTYRKLPLHSRDLWLLEKFIVMPEIPEVPADVSE